MTLAPTDSDDVRGVEGPAYKVGPRCSNPACHRLADHAHHIWRRSKIGRTHDPDWVAFDGIVYGNRAGVCWQCHNDVTGGPGGHRAAIRLILGEFWWCLVSGSEREPHYSPVGLIEPQPPTPDSLALRATDTSDMGSEDCPFCGQAPRRRSTPARVGRRRRKTWIVEVPADEQEQGADVLDSLIDNLAPLIPNADASARGRYYVIVAALVHALMDGKGLAASLAGRGS